MEKIKPYYLLEVVSSDLVFYSFQEKHVSKKSAMEALEQYKFKYTIDNAYIRYCKDILTYIKEPIKPKRFK